MQVGSLAKMRVVAPVAAGALAFALTSDRLLDGGPGVGAVVPATTGAAALGALALGGTAHRQWQWDGVARLADRGMPAARHLAVATAAAAAGVAVGLLLRSVVPASTTGTANDRLHEQARDLRADNEAYERDSVAPVREADEAAQEQLDATTSQVGERLGEPGTVGEGRLDVTGMSPKDAARAVMDAYAPNSDAVGRDAVRVDGANEFHVDYLLDGKDKLDEGGLEKFFSNEVDVRDPEGTITADEVRDWQSGDRRERRTTASDGGG